MQNLHSGSRSRNAGEDRAAAPALMVFVVAALSFFVIAAALATRPEVAEIDANVAMWLHLRAATRMTSIMLAASLLGAPTTLTIVVIVASGVLLYRKRYLATATLLTVVLGGNLLNFCLKLLVERGRPVFEDPLFSLPTYSFPSGHAMASTVFYGLLAICAWVTARRSYGAYAAVVAAVSMIALVCFSRVYLGLHYVSDVAGGVTEGIAWLALAVTASHYFRRGNAAAAGGQ